MLFSTMRVKPRSAGERVHVDGIARAGNGARTERQRVGLAPGVVESIDVPFERRRVREEEVGDEDRLRRTEVRERRHQRVFCLRGAVRERRDDLPHQTLQHQDAPPQIEAEIDRDLLVPRPPGVQAPPGVAEPLDEQPLDEAVDVFVRPGDKRRLLAMTLEQIGERRIERPRVIAAEHSGARQRARPGPAAGDVVLEETAVETERRAPLECRGIRRLIEAAGPERGGLGVRHGWFVRVGDHRLIGRRSTMVQTVLRSLRVTTPVTGRWALSTNASSASRSGRNQPPCATRSA